MRVFVHGIYASGKTYCAREYSCEYSLPYVNFDLAWDYADKNYSAQVTKFFNDLPENYVTDAIPYDDMAGGINEFLLWEFDKDDVQVVVVFCSSKKEWFRRLREVKRKNLEDQFYLNSFYFVLLHRILCLKNRINVDYYDTHKLEFVSYDEFVDRLAWVFSGALPDYVKPGVHWYWPPDGILNVERLRETVQQQKYDWDYQDIDVLGFESHFQTSKTWKDIKELVTWKGQRVVDVGTNHAYIAIKADEQGAKVIGLDKDAARVATAKKIIFVSHSSVQCLVWKSGEPVPKCDTVLCLNTLHHIHNKEKFFQTLNCKNVIFELKLDDVPLVRDHFKVIKEVSSHRGGRTILLCSQHP